jgi:hypothetical protein
MPTRMKQKKVKGPSNLKLTEAQKRKLFSEFTRQILPLLEDFAMYGALMSKDQFGDYKPKTPAGKKMFAKADEYFSSKFYKSMQATENRLKLDWYSSPIEGRDKK